MSPFQYEKESEMKAMKIADIPEVPRSGGIFTDTVSIKTLVGDESKDLAIAIVSFPKGVRNVFHKHPSDQLLFVLSGKGIIADEKKEVPLSPGMVAYIPAGEKHWHGATKDTAFSHISILRPGQETKG
jgi:quercetin dioxygenase-like cupin family protein